jgi:hypothetical protein
MAERSSDSRPTPKMIRLYHRLVQRWGEPTDVFVFDARALDHPINLQLIHVPTWGADEHCELTTLSTLGMSEQRMQGAEYFAELHLAYRGSLPKEQRLALAGLLANIAEYPFEHRLKLDWWEIIPRAGHIPVFSGCRHLLLHPKFHEQGVDVIEDEDGTVKLLYVVPITPFERHLLAEHSRGAFRNYLREEAVDLLADRHDEPRWYEPTEEVG